MSLKLCLLLAAMTLLAIPLVGANCVDNALLLAGGNDACWGYPDMIACGCYDGSVRLLNGSTYDNFKSSEWCCACGGGMNETTTGPPSSMPSNEPTSMPSNEPTAYVQGPISTTCFDLKSSYQNNSCCSQDTGNAATFNGTAVTCGNVLASYKSSECCDADLAKNATMIFQTDAPSSIRRRRAK